MNIEFEGQIIGLVQKKGNNKIEVIETKNALLNKGRVALTKSILGEEKLYITSMVFGDGGFDHEVGKKKSVDRERNSLFGLTKVEKSVVAQIDPEVPWRGIFSVVIGFDDGNDSFLNEMALKLNNGDLYSMATFPNLGKTDQMQIIWRWYANFL